MRMIHGALLGINILLPVIYSIVFKQRRSLPPVPHQTRLITVGYRRQAFDTADPHQA
jgi:hypothetical protein